MNLESHFVDVHGLRMHYVCAGDGPTVILMHGFPDTHEIWRHQIPALARAGYRVIAPDMRGYGKTDAPESTGAYAIEFLCADILGLMDALGVEKAALVGHDWGGLVGWQLCMNAPQRFERFVAMSTGHPAAIANAGVTQQMRFWYILGFLMPVVAEHAIRANDWFFLRQMTRRKEQLAIWRAALEPEGRLTAALNYYRANIKLGRPHHWRPVEVSVMGIWSDRDPALGEKQMLDSAHHCRAGFRYEALSGAGHWMQLSATERLNALLLDFLPPYKAAA
ncbi:alpha/beta fold hydrolase [Massilia sp. BKSP1R2A-1]|uniref:alpha/beta fold hydrolase n=1 Tax=Massilia sp. BKSP1R2A-1 TaxID=3422595 RepID=UPI003D32E796